MCATHIAMATRVETHDSQIAILGTNNRKLETPAMSIEPSSDSDEDDCTKAQPQRLGLPKRKTCIVGADAAALALSTTCCVLAIAIGANDSLAWCLGFTNQLILAGFLLSVINMCMGNCTNFLFVLLEARFGRSKLQNYDKLLRNQILGPGLDVAWRIVLSCTMALPIGLGVAYKTFQGGSSLLLVNTTDITGLPPEYGIFNLPNSFGGEAARYFNVSLPFLSAASLIHKKNGGDKEPTLPDRYPQYYGSHMMLLGPNSTAILDLPRDTRPAQLQDSLNIGEHLRLEAHVRGSVATQSEISPDHDPDFAEALADDNMLISYASMLEGGVFLFAPVELGNNSRVWLGYAPGRRSRKKLALYGKRYDIQRHSCRGVWRVTRAGVQLSSGSCERDPLPAVEQYIFVKNAFKLRPSFMQIIRESVNKFSDFGGVRNTSVWKNPSLTTAIGAAAWSKAVQSANLGFNRSVSVFGGRAGCGCCNLTLEDYGLLYEVPDEKAKVVRPALRRSRLLYLVFAVQPILMVITMAGALLLYSVPLDHGFGMISILAGVSQNRDQLDLFRGASLSGELRGGLRLSFLPVHGKGNEGYVECRIVGSGSKARLEPLERGVEYS